MNNGKERKITVWGYKYDNGEIALLYHDTGTWRGKKINTVHVEYYQTTQAAVVRICELEAKIPSEDMPLECDWRTVIKTVREQQPDYLLGKSKNVRLPVDGESRLCATLVLSVEKLSWLPKVAQNMLLELTMLIAPQN